MTEPRRVTPELLREWPLPEPGSDKESRGVVLVVGGNRGTPGAVILSGEASLRVGGGKLQVATAAHNAAQVARALPEALVAGLAQDDNGDIASKAARRSCRSPGRLRCHCSARACSTPAPRPGCSARSCRGWRARSSSTPSGPPTSPTTPTACTTWTGGP